MVFDSYSLYRQALYRTSIKHACNR